MLLIDVAHIPLEGQQVACPLEPGAVHLEGERSFTLEPGGSVDCRVERGDEDSVHVRGRLHARLSLECGRCLAPFPIDVDQELDLFYLRHNPDDAREAEDEVQLSDRDMVVAFYSGPRLDLGDVLREQLFLATPLKGLCRDECRGLCSVCGANRNSVACDCTPPADVDPRLSVLGQLFPKGSS
jgi:uncharacterized protein